jgi:hypothetical protein
MPLNPEASKALANLIQKYGESIIKMPSSCLIYMSAKLADYPDEKDLLADALRRGIPEQILQHAGDDDYESKLASMSQMLAKAARIDPEWAADVVTAWAEALNRPVGFQKKQIVDRVYPDAPRPESLGEKAIMTLIVGFGGFLGTAIGAGLACSIILGTEVAVNFAAWAIGFKMLIAGLAGGIAAVLGWLMGGRSKSPWAGFAAAFGSGFTMAMILLSFTLRSPLFRIGIIAVSVFGATFVAAARGGHRK